MTISFTPSLLFIPQKNNYSSEAGFTNCKQKTLENKNEEVAINYFISVDSRRTII